METYNKIIHSKFLYIFFIFLSLNIFFFSTVKSDAKAFDINNIEISRPFEMKFNKNEVINEGFKEAFYKLISFILNSSDQKKIGSIKLNEIKGMIESFSIKEEKFIDEIYNVNLGVSFNKKKVFGYLEKKNIFPSIPVKKNFLFIPIIIDENKKDLLIFYNNKIFNMWNEHYESSQLIEYILPTEDLEDLNQIKNNYELIEQYDFKEIIKKYNLDNSIIALIFKGVEEIRVLSRITTKNDIILQNQTFASTDVENIDQVKIIIEKLKVSYEDYWKDFNKINTSIKLPLSVKISNSNNFKILELERNLKDIDLVYDFYISKFDKDFTYFQIIFNGTPSIFLETMNDKDYSFDTQKKVWTVK